MAKAMGKSMPDFSMMVKEIRRQLGLSQEAFGQELGVICAATAALTLEEKLTGQKQIKALEAQRNQKRRSFFL